MSGEFDAVPTNVMARGGVLTVPGVELVVVEGPDAGLRARVEQGTARVGTARANQLCLSDRAVSRLHCELTVRGDAVTLRDAGSTNGTFIDGRRVRDMDLSAGTIVHVGATAFRVEWRGEPDFLELSRQSRFGDVIGGGAEMRRVFAILEKVAPTEATVLVLGETGTGKEVVARAIHDSSRRRDGPFATLDCGAIPESLIESELFGHVRGAFTGAVSDRRGVFEEADGGTLFLDEIGELPLTMQPKLLRALETRRVRPIGGGQHRSVDVRVIAATHRALARSVNQGSFREDLYYRLAVVEVELPPLRARREDIPALVAHLLERITGHPQAPPPEMLSALATREWPGNVRELRNVIERSVSLGWEAAAGPPLRPAGAAGSSPDLAALVPVHLPLKDARLAWTEQFESVYVRALLAKTGGNVTRAAALAGVSRRFLQRTMARVGIRSASIDDEDG